KSTFSNLTNSFMRLCLIFNLLVISAHCAVQQSPGINFEKNLNWAEVKQKAKKENKLIFMDEYTTWCIPCGQMSENIFPLAEVGEFFNKNFINVAVQMDVTKNDSKYEKSWYKDAKMI